MTYLVLYALLLGFFAFGLTVIVRAVVPQAWLLHKPFACDLCMSWWSSWSGAVLLHYSEPVGFDCALVAVVAATGLSWLALKAGNRLGE